MFDHYLRLWSLAADGEPIITHTSQLLPVRSGATPAMLKIATYQEERRGNRALAWWAGEGAARVLAQEGDTVLMERAAAPDALAALVAAGRDDEASRILCAVAARLHRHAAPPPPYLVPLDHWFRPLARMAPKDGRIAAAAAAARHLLDTQADIAVLHGDLHHGNVLDFDGEWRAIDPKGIIGDRAFDFANMLRNPDRATVLRPGRLGRQAEVICQAAGLARDRLLGWVLAFSGLSAAWRLADGREPGDFDLAMIGLATEELARG